jgi:hypothetical protein
VSQFTQFFNQAAAGAAAGQAGNIFAGIRPPKFATFGNSQNYSVTSQWKTENFIPNRLGYVLGINFGEKITVATWNNTLVWSATDGVTGSGSVVNALIYNQVLDKWYMATTVTGAGVYEVDILTGARTLITATVPAFLSQGFPTYACLSYCTADGLYEWRDGDTIRLYNQSFVEVRRRSFVATNNVNSGLWYYTEDCRIRARPVTSWRGQGSASSNTIAPDRVQLLIERYGSRRLVELTAEMVFSAHNANNYALAATAQTPMAPEPSTGVYLGNAVRLGKNTRNTTAIADPYLLDRADYDRWLGDVADALGMPAAPAFYGDWINV